jgi:hypothetical protein
MSIEISLSGLAKSQLLTLKGEAVSDFSPAGGMDISGARLQQSQSAIRLQNVVIDNKAETPVSCRTDFKSKSIVSLEEQ